ncbi:MAG: O-antigen ligase family protein [Bauldia sp.]|nr:O-antigen ligase family protein [Bauldia sp.]
MFLLGASRGALLAGVLFVSLVVMFTRQNHRRPLIIAALFGGLALVALLSELAGGSVLDRFLSIGSDIATGSSRAIRLVYWSEAWSLFLASPLFGHALYLPNGEYVHNIVLEVAMAMGVVGLVLLAIAVGLLLKCVGQSLRNGHPDVWLAAFPVLYGTSALFSGSFIISGEVWMSFGLAWVAYRVPRAGSTLSRPAIGHERLAHGSREAISNVR